MIDDAETTDFEDAVLPAVMLLSCSLMTSKPAPSSPVDAAVIRRLVDALKDSDPDVRNNLATALAKIGTASVEPLMEALSDKNAERRAGAAYSLGLIGSSARVALPTLLDLLKDDDVSVRRQASFAIGKIVPAGGGGK